LVKGMKIKIIKNHPISILFGGEAQYFVDCMRKIKGVMYVRRFLCNFKPNKEQIKEIKNKFMNLKLESFSQ